MCTQVGMGGTASIRCPQRSYPACQFIMTLRQIQLGREASPNGLPPLFPVHRSHATHACTERLPIHAPGMQNADADTCCPAKLRECSPMDDEHVQRPKQRA